MINGSAILLGSTFGTPTGGSTGTFLARTDVPNGMAYTFAEQTSVSLQDIVTITAKAPKVSAGSPSGYTQARARAVLKRPYALASGVLVINTVSVEVAYDVNTSAALVTDLRNDGSVMLTNANLNTLWALLSPM